MNASFFKGHSTRIQHKCLKLRSGICLTDTYAKRLCVCNNAHHDSRSRRLLLVSGKLL